MRCDRCGTALTLGERQKTLETARIHHFDPQLCEACWTLLARPPAGMPELGSTITVLGGRRGMVFHTSGRIAYVALDSDVILENRVFECVSVKIPEAGGNPH